MADKVMTLMMKIQAQADSAVIQFNKVDSLLLKIQDRTKELSGYSKTAFGAIGNAVSLTLLPLKLALQAGTALAATLIGVATASIFAAAEDEKLIRRLEAVYGSSDKANTVLGALEEQSVKSGKASEDMAEGLMLLQQYGLASSRSLFAVTNAAKVAGSSVEEMAMSVAVLQSRGPSGLKKIGIELDGKDGGYFIRARDASGKLREVMVKDAEAAKRKLIDIMAFKFGVNMQATTFSGMLNGLKNGLGVAAGQFGYSMMESLKPLLSYLSSGMVKLLESGKIEELGRKAGEWITDAVDVSLALFKTLPKVWEGLKNIWNKGGDALGNFIVKAFSVGAGIFSDIFVGVMEASVRVWASIGELLTSIFMKQILQLPGMENLRQEKIATATSSMTKHEYADMAEKYNIGANTDFRDLPVNVQAEIATSGKYKAVSKTIDKLKNDLGQIYRTAEDSGKERLRGLNNDFHSMSGVDVDAEFKKNRQEVRNARLYGPIADKNMVTARFKRYGDDQSGQQEYYYRSVITDPGRLKKGQTVSGGGVVININELKIHANEPKDVTDGLIMEATKAMGGAY